MKLFAQQEAEAFLKTGAKEFRYNRDTRLTPGAKDVFSEAGIKLVFDDAVVSTPAAGGGAAAPAAAVPAATPDEALFHSPEAERIKQEICEIGYRMWLREYCDGNGGNISARLTSVPDRYICTPTRVSKGFLKPEMLCMVDGQGNQVAGTWPRSSEVRTHIAIYETTPDAKAVCHAHPCHAGAFAIKGMTPPPRLIPELEVFVGVIAFAEYKTPGSDEMIAAIRPLAPQHQSMIMGNHGVITWGNGVEDAYFKMEITDAYCRTIILAQNVPGGIAIPGDKMVDLLGFRKALNLPDSRYGLKPAELADTDPWAQMCGSHGCSSPVTPWNPMARDAGDPATEALIQKITDEILANLAK